MKKPTLLALLLLPALLAGAQGVRLTRYDAPTALYWKANDLFRYNRYEQARFDLGLTWVIPNENARRQEGEPLRRPLGQWQLHGDMGYGTADRELKGRLDIQLRLPGSLGTRLKLSGFKDMERAGERKLSGYDMLSVSQNTAMTSSRFSAVRGAQFEVSATPHSNLGFALALRQTWEEYRFDSVTRLYPAIDPAEQAPVRCFSELEGRLNCFRDLTLQVRTGRMAVEGEARHYLRALAQYSHSTLPDGGCLSLFAQMGYATGGTPYSRLFDLSGSGGYAYYFRNTFLTVRPNTFTANLFAHLCVNVTAPLPLWELSWSRPQLFAQVNAAWGQLLDAGNTGRTVCDGMPLQAPYMGIFEPATGFYGLLHWGILDVGVAVAYQMVPLQAPYLSIDPSECFAFMAVAELIFDKKLPIQYINNHSSPALVK